MNHAEAIERTTAIRHLANDVREHLYQMFTRDGWRTLGYESWQKYLAAEFSISHSYLRRQTNAGMIEAEIGAEIGTYKESHLRPISELLDNPNERAVALGIVARRFKSPVARDFEIVAKEVWLDHHASGTIVSRYDTFEVDIDTAYTLGRFVSTCDANSALYHIASWVSDTDLLPILERIAKADTETWKEIVSTWHIPSYPDQIPLDKATAGALLAYLDVASHEHRAQAIESKKEFYALKGELTDKIVSAAREIVSGDYVIGTLDVLAVLIKQLDDLESNKD